MRLLKTVAILVLCTGVLLNASSCIVLVEKDHGKHKGWYKNTNNPHHPNSTNPGNGNSKHKHK